MRVLVLGGSGFIGSAVVRELVARRHHVLGLARSAASAAKLSTLGASAIAGDIAAPAAWVVDLPPIDAIIHMACDVATDMATIEHALLDALLPTLAHQRRRPRFIYTGGCWLFGATGDRVANEETPFDPLPAFAWMVPHGRRVLAAREVDGVIVHPAMVFDGIDGVFGRFAREARERRPIRVVGGENVRWPLVHRDDLAQLYALALERAPTGSTYIGAAIEGVLVGRIARAFARHARLADERPQMITADAIAAELGDWARGYALDQQLTGAKARAELGWKPRHLDPEEEIGRPTRRGGA